MMSLRDRYVEAYLAAWNHGSVDAFGAVMLPGFSRHSRQGSMDLVALKRMILDARDAFPDLTTELDEILDTNRGIVMRWTSVGSHERPYLGVAATGRRVSVSGVTIVHFEDDGVIEEHVTWNPTDLLRSAGSSVLSDEPAVADRADPRGPRRFPWHLRLAAGSCRADAGPGCPRQRATGGGSHEPGRNPRAAGAGASGSATSAGSGSGSSPGCSRPGPGSTPLSAARHRPVGRSPGEPFWVRLLLHQELRRLRQDLHLQLELADATSGLAKLRALPRRHAGLFAPVDQILPDPVVQTRLADAQFGSRTGDRLARAHERNGPCPELGRKRTWHDSQPSSKARTPHPAGYLSRGAGQGVNQSLGRPGSPAGVLPRVQRTGAVTVVRFPGHQRHRCFTARRLLDPPLRMGCRRAQPRLSGDRNRRACPDHRSAPATRALSGRLVVENAGMARGCPSPHTTAASRRGAAGREGGSLFGRLANAQMRFACLRFLWWGIPDAASGRRLGGSPPVVPAPAGRKRGTHRRTGNSG